MEGDREQKAMIKTFGDQTTVQKDQYQYVQQIYNIAILHKGIKIIHL